FFFNDTATTEIYTLSLHDALPISIWSAEACSLEQHKRRSTSHTQQRCCKTSCTLLSYKKPRSDFPIVGQSFRLRVRRGRWPATGKSQRWPPPGPPESFGMGKMRQTAPKEAVGCIIDGYQDDKTEILVKEHAADAGHL